RGDEEFADEPEEDVPGGRAGPGMRRTAPMAGGQGDGVSKSAHSIPSVPEGPGSLPSGAGGREIGSSPGNAAYFIVMLPSSAAMCRSSMVSRDQPNCSAST